ncbi:hypothetical protein B0H14DRAFT_2596899 [Mycena olivaceomarginata]|nr:hypothetical protein B0H14DRAFT_2596899 [Mycena olivaceomarginata]
MYKRDIGRWGSGLCSCAKIVSKWGFGCAGIRAARRSGCSGGSRTTGATSRGSGAAYSSGGIGWIDSEDQPGRVGGTGTHQRIAGRQRLVRRRNGAAPRIGGTPAAPVQRGRARDGCRREEDDSGSSTRRQESGAAPWDRVHVSSKSRRGRGHLRGHRWRLEGLWDGSQARTTTTARYGAGAEHGAHRSADRGHGAGASGGCGRLSGLEQGQRRRFGAGWTGSTREAVTAADRSPGWDELGWVGASGRRQVAANTARAGCIDLHRLWGGAGGIWSAGWIGGTRRDGGILGPLARGDTIPSTLDNLTMHIHFSDLVACGTVLDMEVMSVDLHKPRLQMSGRHCNITSQELKIHALVMMAKGLFKFGNVRRNLSAWGYNSVDTLFETIITRAETEDWSRIGVTMDAVRKRLEGDTDIQWAGKWSAPATTRVGFLLTVCGNPAVAHSFPHSLLMEWPDSARHLVVRTAWNLISQGVGFIESPPDLCASLNGKRVVQNHYKLTKKGGGGEWRRSWLEHGHWGRVRSPEQVPILAELHKLIEEGHLSVEWGKGYNANLNRNSDNSKEFRAQADTLCWLQSMMLDTWIARRIDLLILKDTDEAAVPVDIATANKYAAMAVSDTDHAKGRTIGWKKSRCRFTRYYLARLADGISREDGRVGASCMSPNGGIDAAGWVGMPVGKPKDWATLDAVLSLRAVLMATRFELMYNTDVFLELQRCGGMLDMSAMWSPQNHECVGIGEKAMSGKPRTGRIVVISLDLPRNATRTQFRERQRDLMPLVFRPAKLSMKENFRVDPKTFSKETKLNFSRSPRETRRRWRAIPQNSAFTPRSRRPPRIERESEKGSPAYASGGRGEARKCLNVYCCQTNGCFFEHYSGGSGPAAKHSILSVGQSFCERPKMPVYIAHRLWNPPYLPPWDYLTRPYHLCIDDAHNPLRPANRAQAIIPQDIPQDIPIPKLDWQGYYHTIEHNAVDKLHTVAAEESSRSTRGCYSCRRKSTTPVHEELDCISPTAIPSLSMSWPRLFGVRSGVYLYTVHAGNTARLHAPHHPHSVDRALHKLGPSYSHQHPKPKECFIDPRLHLHCPRAHLFAPLRPSPVHAAPPDSPFIDRVCAPDDGVCEEVLGGLGLRLRAAASDRSRREALVAMIIILPGGCGGGCDLIDDHRYIKSSMAPARLSCLDPICARLVKRTSGDMIISGRVYVEDLRVLPLAPTMAALTVGNPVRPKEAASIPALISTSTADRVSSSPYAIQVYPRICGSRTPPRPPLVHAARSLEPAPTSHSIVFRRSSPRAARPYDCRAIPMRFPTTHTVFEEVHPPRAAARRTWPWRFGSSRQHTAGGVWLGPTRRGGAPRARRAPTHPPSEAIGSLPRFEKIKTAESGGAECRAVPRTRGSTAPARSRVLSTPPRSGVYPGAGRGCITAHRASSSLIHPHALAASQRRAHYARASSTAVLSIGAAAGELSLPQVAAEKILGDGAERLNRWPQVPKQLSLGLDYTNRPTVFSRPSVHLIYTAQGTGAHLHPVLSAGLFAAHLISSRRALPHLDYATMRFRGDAGSRRCACAAAGSAGSGSFGGSLPPYKCSYGVLARPPDPSIPHLDRTARCLRST